MTHEELIDKLAERLDWDHAKATEVLESMVTVMNEQLVNNIQISIDGVGVFETLKNEEHISLDPITQARYLVPPEVVAVFIPDIMLNNRLVKGDDYE
ncbi:MAG: HU family DNA-binding protein [Dysgonamonadaceae bacterium]|jgi:DNA-binding protein HU-beta|nr:HU family DNA-binding protein [Dysgonamonadaceae bacterium]MDD3308507.1 HU family DNA-binding protein [Dysgonamonadaceae bacterium]MDD3899908.1 HU family DNA-binding protein [Dysgonamonadaceae bacterium]MDD4398733.1 HU family DNA-binding protein [Dysgonamonadaceae bacterium]MEA5081403.1 HU family DNA-binding protein [Dysgonamonadaceae bacterium]